MGIIKSLAAAIAIGASLITTAPATAGLGSAATKGSTKGYDAWCGEKGNNCKVKFADGVITVDRKNSVRFEDLTYITRNFEQRDYVHGGSIVIFEIEYLEEGMDSPEYAEIIFQHFPTSNRFWLDLKRACRQCKDRDATQVEVEVDIKK